MTNGVYVSQSKYQAGLGMIFWGMKFQTFMIPTHSTTVLYDYYYSFTGITHFRSRVLEKQVARFIN